MLALLAGALIATPASRALALVPGARRSTQHPEPRAGVDGSRVLARGQVPDDLAPLFDGIRRHARLADGVRCSCGCAEVPGFRSLLSCFEGDGMAQHCDVCQEAARIVVRMGDRKRSLAQIRAAIDAELG